MARPNMSEVVRVLDIANGWAEASETKLLDNRRLTGVFLPAMVDVTVPTTEDHVVVAHQT